jgi:MipA family protein
MAAKAPIILIKFMDCRQFSVGHQVSWRSRLTLVIILTMYQSAEVTKGDFLWVAGGAVNIIKIEQKATLFTLKNCAKNLIPGLGAGFFSLVIAFTVFFVGCTLPVGQAKADEKPLWELGVGVSALRLPVYRGSNEFKNLALPLPYFVYRGERLKLDREGGRGLLFKTDRLELDISVSGSFPVNSANNEARVGMPGLKATLEVGPLLIASLWHSDDQNALLTARFPLRGVMTSNFIGAGFVFQPQLAYDVRNFAGTGWVAGIRGGPLFQSRAYADYFYGVPAAFSTASRPSYQGSSGYGGYNVLAGGSKRYGNTWIGAFAKYDNLSGASFDDSPLIRKKQFFTVGLAISWIFAESSTKVQAND